MKLKYILLLFILTSLVVAFVSKKAASNKFDKEKNSLSQAPTTSKNEFKPSTKQKSEDENSIRKSPNKAPRALKTVARNISSIKYPVKSVNLESFKDLKNIKFEQSVHDYFTRQPQKKVSIKFPENFGKTEITKLLKLYSQMNSLENYDEESISIKNQLINELNERSHEAYEEILSKFDYYNQYKKLQGNFITLIAFDIETSNLSEEKKLSYLKLFFDQKMEDATSKNSLATLTLTEMAIYALGGMNVTDDKKTELIELFIWRNSYDSHIYKAVLSKLSEIEASYKK